MSALHSRRSARRLSQTIIAAALAFTLSFAAVAGDVRAAEEPSIAAAASLRNALDEIAAAFATDAGKKVKLTYGATGNLITQIESGAPFELFIAADEAAPAKLAKSGKTDGEPTVLVRGRLVIAAPKASPVTVDGDLAGLKAAIESGKVAHLSIANPELAPYGKAAREALEHAGLWDKLEGKIVMGENIGQAAQFVTTGAAEAGLVAQSLTLTPEFTAAANTAVIPEDWYKPINQAMALIKGAGETARAFAAFLKSDKARAVFEKYGFAVP